MLVHMLLVSLSVPQNRVVERTGRRSFFRVVFPCVVKQLLFRFEIRIAFLKRKEQFFTMITVREEYFETM